MTSATKEQVDPLVPGGDASKIEIPEFPGLTLSLEEQDGELAVTAVDADGDEVENPPPAAAVLGALRFAPDAQVLENPPAALNAPVLQVAQRYPGDEDPPVIPGVTIEKSGTVWVDSTTQEPIPVDTPTYSEWRYDDGSPAAGTQSDGRYIVNDRDVGRGVKVVETCMDVVSESNVLTVEGAAGGLAPLTDTDGNLLPVEDQPADVVLPPTALDPPPEEATRQYLEEEVVTPQATTTATTSSTVDLDSMTKDELIALAQERGISPANQGMSKDELRASIERAE